MTTQELLTLIMMGGAGVAGGVAQGQQNKQNAAAQTQNQLNNNVQNMMAALQNAQQTSQNLQTNRQNMPQTQASLSPLGQEQSFLQKQRMMQALLPQIANFSVGGPTDPGIKAAFTPPTNLLAGVNSPKVQQAFGDQATATSLADRRKLMAQINPDYQFSSLGEFGLDPKYDQGVGQASIDAGARLKAYEAAQTSLANQQTQLVQQQMLQQQQQQQQEKKKGGGVMGAIGGLLKTAAPFASLIPGVGPLASMGIGAAGAALGDKMQGNSMGHALGAGLLGGAATGVGEGLQSLSKGQGFNPFNNKALPTGAAPSPLVGFAGTVKPQGPELDLPSTSINAFSPLAGTVGQNKPNLSPSGGVKPPTPTPGGVPRSYGIPTLNTVPYQQPSYIGANPQGRVPLPGGPTTDMQAKVNAMLDDQNKNNPMFSNPFFMSLPPTFGGGQGPASAGPQQQVLGPGPTPGRLIGQGGPPAGPAQLPGSSPMPQLTGTSPRALPQGQYNMGPIAGVGPNQAQIPARVPSTLAELKKMFASMPDGPAKLQQMAKLLMGK